MARFEKLDQYEDAYSRHAREMDEVENAVLVILLVAAICVLLTFNWPMLP